MSSDKKVIWKRLYELLKPYRGGVIALMVMTVLQSLLQVALALMSQRVIDTALAADGKLWMAGLVLILILLALMVLHTLLSWCAGSTVDHCVARLRQELLTAAAHSDGQRLQAFHSGELLSRGMEDARAVCDGVVNALPSLVGQVTRLVASFGAVFLLHPPIALLLLIAAVGIGALAAVLRPVLKKQHRIVREAETKVMANMQEDLQQLELIQSIGAEKRILQRFGQHIKNSLHVKKTRRYWTVGTSSLFSAISQIGTGALLLWGASQVASGGLSYGSLTALIQLLAIFRGPVLGISGLWTRLAGVEVSGERLLDILAEEEQTEQPRQMGNVSAVVFENVTFHYPGDESTVVENFSARFPLEGWACLTGISGRGKTTLFKLILGLYPPQNGRVYLETDQGQIPCGKDTRHLFAYVPQDYALFSGTVLENLLLVAPDADEKKRRAALEAAQADFIWSLTEGENTPVRENNAGLSKGQLQRLAIARAILMDRQIFLLDECTSALDHQTEELVLQSLRNMGKSAILVTHRPEALEELDGIVSVSMEA